jgi:peroxiredoxin
VFRQGAVELQAKRGPSPAVPTQLAGTELPNAVLQSFDGRLHDMDDLSYSWVAYYFYSGIQSPPPDRNHDVALDAALHRAYRDQRDSFAALGLRVIGIGSESGAEQLATITTHRIVHRMLIDPECQYARLLNLPVYEVDGRTHYRPLTLLARDRRIAHAFFPIEAPSRNPSQVLTWMRVHGARASS